MERLVIGKKYTTKSDNKQIDFDYKVLDISNDRVLFKVLTDRTILPFSNYNGVKSLKYNIKSQFIRNSKVLIWEKELNMIKNMKISMVKRAPYLC